MALKAAKAPLNAAMRPRSQAQPEDVRSIALDLAPLVAKYRSRGRFSLRVERMQQHARLSRGRNNGDRSWSLMCDELEGLEYLVRGDTLEAHSLSVRIVDIEQDGSTLAVLEIAVPLDGKPTGAGNHSGSSGVARADRETKNLKSEVDTLRAELATRERELAKRTAELTDAREGARTELQQQLAAANALAAQALEEKRMQWQSERDALISGHERAAEQSLATARAQWEHESKDAALAAALGRDDDRKLQRQMEEAVAQASARAEKAEAALAAASAQQAAQDAVHSADQQARQDELSKKLAEMTVRAEQSDAALVRANSDIVRIDKEMRAEISRLNAAIAAREAEEAVRLAIAEQGWKEQADKSAAALVERCARAEADGASALAEAVAKAALAEKELRDTLSITMENLRERETALAEAHAQIAKYAGDAAQHDRTSAELAAARAELTECRSPPLPEAAGKDLSAAVVAEIEQRVRQEAADALTKAEGDWAKAEATRLAEAETRFQERSEAALRQAKTRAHEAEKALTKLRKELASSVRSESSGREIEQLHDQIITLQADLAGRESELARLNQIVRENELYGAGHRPQQTEDSEENSGSAGRLVRDFIVVVVMVAIPIILFPYVEPMLPYKWQYEIETAIPLLASNPGNQAGPQAAPAQKATLKPVAAPKPGASVARTARLHAGPKTSSVTLSIIPSGIGVSVIRKSGNWTMVRAGIVQGWIYDSYLKDASKAKSGH